MPFLTNDGAARLLVVTRTVLCYGLNVLHRALALSRVLRVAEVIEEWLDQPYSPEAVAANDNLVDEFDGDEDEKVFVRNYVTTTMLRQALGANPVIRDLKMAPDKVIGQALRSLDGWENLCKCRRVGRQARWYCRIDNDEEFLPLETIRPQAVPEEPDVDDLLG